MEKPGLKTFREDLISARDTFLKTEREIWYPHIPEDEFLLVYKTVIASMPIRCKSQETHTILYSYRLTIIRGILKQLNIWFENQKYINPAELLKLTQEEKLKLTTDILDLPLTQ